MKDLSAVSPGSAQVLEPVTEGSLDELPVTLIPAQEDELPQGVLDLIATLIVRHRSETLVSVGDQGLDRRGLSSLLREQTHSHRETHSNVDDQGLDRRGFDTRLREQIEPSHRLFQREMHPDVGATVRRLDLLAKAAEQAPINPQGSPRVSIGSPSTTPEPLPVERAATVSAPTTPVADAPLPEALMNLHGMRQALSVAPVSIPLPPAPIPKPALDMKIETLPDSNRNMLQIPFNNGVASGQVTITRVPDELTHNLLLSPSNTLVLEQLKAPFELVRDPGWRLTDSGDEQQHQGSHQSPDEEQDEHQELPA